MSIRLRLALWYTVLLATMFLVFAPVVYFTLERQLLLEVDRWLAPVGERALRSLGDDPAALHGLEGSPAPRPSPEAGILDRLAAAGFTLAPNPEERPLPANGPPAPARGASVTGAAAPITSATNARNNLEGQLAPLTSPGVFVEVLDPNGRVLARSPNLGSSSVPVPDGAFATAWWGAPSSFTASLDGMRYRGLLSPIPGETEPGGFVLTARSLESIDGALSGVRILLLVGNALGLLVAAGVGWLIARNGLRPIEEITQTARAIALSQGFGRRLKVEQARDEVGQLAVTFNEMLASLDAANAAQRRFVADASHELRSPLTSIRSNVDILRRALDAPREDRAEALADVGSEIDRISRLTSDLLLLARADAGHRIEMEKVALDDLMRDVHRQMAPRADGIALEMGSLRRTVVLGNATWLKQLLLILLDNALKYTPRGGSVSLLLGRDGDLAVVRVRDTGIGIAAQDLAQIFERFYRADKARARDEGGTGLGLSVAQWIADEHGGELSVESEVGKGTTFSLRLPAIS